MSRALRTRHPEIGNGRGFLRVAPMLAAALAVAALLAACGSGGSAARQAEGETGASTSPAVAGDAPADSLAGGVITCPEQTEKGDAYNRDFQLDNAEIVNETDMTFKVVVPPGNWSCDDFSGVDNPSKLNGLVIPPNSESPLIVPVRPRWNAPNMKVSVLKNDPGSDMPWTPVAATEWLVGGYYGYVIVKPGTDRFGSYPLRGSDGADVGTLTFAWCDHQGEYFKPTGPAIRFWSMDPKPCVRDGSVLDGGVLDDGIPQLVR